MVNDGWAGTVKGVGIDEQTALAVEPNGAVTVPGSGAAYFLRTPGTPPEVCQNKTPLTYTNLSVYRVAGAATFNLATWNGSSGTAYMLHANNGVLTSSQAGGAIY